MGNQQQAAITKELAYDRLRQVIDPELGIDIVSIGLIYQVEIKSGKSTASDQQKPYVFITMTLTTPGCPLAGVINTMVVEAFSDIEHFDPTQQVHVEVTFDPPWVPDMMTEEARAELGLV